MNHFKTIRVFDATGGDIGDVANTFYPNLPSEESRHRAIDHILLEGMRNAETVEERESVFEWAVKHLGLSFATASPPSSMYARVLSALDDLINVYITMPPNRLSEGLVAVVGQAIATRDAAKRSS